MCREPHQRHSLKGRRAITADTDLRPLPVLCDLSEASGCDCKGAIELEAGQAGSESCCCRPIEANPANGVSSAVGSASLSSSPRQQGGSGRWRSGHAIDGVE